MIMTRVETYDSIKEDMLERMAGGMCYAVFGARHTGKSTFLKRLEAEFQRYASYLSGYHSLRDLQIEDDSDFITRVADAIIQQLVTDYASSEFLTAEFREQTFIDQLQHIGETCEADMVIMLDHMEIVHKSWLPHLIQLLVESHEYLKRHSKTNFQVVLCSASVDVYSYLLTGRDMGHIFAYCLLPDCNISETKAWFFHHFHDQFPINGAAINYLHEITGGDVLLVDRIAHNCLVAMKAGVYQRVTRKRVDESVDRLVAHPDVTGLPPLRLIEQDVELLRSVLMSLDSKEAIHEFPIDTRQAINALSISGLFRRDENGAYSIKNGIWKRILEQHLTAERIGDLFSIHGDWKSAFSYVARGLKANPMLESHMFNTIIQAIYTQESLDKGLFVLLSGLRQLYPVLDVHIYKKIDRSKLQLTLSSEDIYEDKFIALNDMQSREIGVLIRGDYKVHRGDLYLPLQTGENSFGVVVIEKLFGRGKNDNQWAKSAVLFRFIQQVSSALYTRQVAESAYRQSADHASKLENLNYVLTSILQNEENLQVMYELVLTAVTAHWGLAFNRAILILRDEKRRCFVVKHAIGQLSRPVATEEWKHLLNLSCDEMVASVVNAKSHTTDLHEAVAGMRFDFDSGDGRDLMAVLEKQEIVVSRNRDVLPVRLSEVLEISEEFVLVSLGEENRSIGCLYADFHFTGQKIDPQLSRMLTTFVTHISSIVLSHRSRIHEVTEQTERLKQLVAMQREISLSTTGADDTVKNTLLKIVESIVKLMDADCGVIYTLKPGSFSTEYIATYPEGIADSFRNPNSDGGIGGWIVQSGYRFVENVSHYTNPALPGNHSLSDSSFIREQNVKSFVGVRIGSHDKPVGVLYINWRSPYVMSEEARNLIDVFVQHTLISINSARGHQRLEFEAQHKNRFELIRSIYSQEIDRDLDIRIESRLGELLYAMLSLDEISLLIREYDGSWINHRLIAGSQLERETTQAIEDVNLQRIFARAEAEEEPGQTYDLKHSSNRGNQERIRILGVPIRVNNNVVALLTVVAELPESQRVNMMHYMVNLADELAVNFEYIDMARALINLRKISTTLTGLVSDHQLSATLGEIVNAAQAATRTIDIITLYYIDRPTGRLRLGAINRGIFKEIPMPHNPHLDPAVVMVSRADEAIFNDPALLDNEFARVAGIESSAGFPLKHQGRRFGCMFFNSRYVHDFTGGEKILFELITETASIAIHRALLLQRVRIVDDIAKAISKHRSSDLIYETLLVRIKEIVENSHNVCLVEKDSQKEELVIPASSLRHYKPDNIALYSNAYRVSYKEKMGVAGLAMQEGRTICVNDVHDYPDYIPAIASTRSQIAVPVPIGANSDGTEYAALVVESDETDAFSEDDQELLESIARHASVAMQKARAVRDERRELLIFLLHQFSHHVPPNIKSTVDELVSKLPSDVVAQSENPIKLLRRTAFKARRYMRQVQMLVQEDVMVIQPDTYPLETLVAQAVEATSYELPDHISPITTDIPPDLWVRVDPGWTRHVFESIIENAYKYIPESRFGEIHISAVPDFERERVEVRFRDNGPGIPAELRDEIFNIGKSESLDTRPLKGFGLNYCRRVVQEQKGQIKVESKAGIGAVFLVTLPVEMEEEDDD